MEEVYNQLFCALMFVITGITVGILFDIFRILRKSFKTADFITYLQDILFWIFAGIIVLFSIFKFNNGEIRSYIFLGIALGILLYMTIMSKFIIKYSVIIINFIKKIFAYPIKLLSNILQKILIKPIIIVYKNIQNFIKKQKTTAKSMKTIKNK